MVDKRQGQQVTFWLNPEKSDQQFLLEVLEWYKTRGINISDALRQGLRIMYFIDTNNREGLLRELPTSLNLGERVAISSPSSPVFSSYQSVDNNPEGLVQISENSDIRGLAHQIDDGLSELF